jgi:hypothetical protein
MPTAVVILLSGAAMAYSLRSDNRALTNGCLQHYGSERIDQRGIGQFAAHTRSDSAGRLAEPLRESRSRTPDIDRNRKREVQPSEG